MIQRPAAIGNRGFSLVELLVVLTIMGILSVLAVSSVSSLRSTALSASGNQMVDVMDMARQNAIAKNDFTAVVILTQGSSACSAYCLIELPNAADGSRGTNWVQLSPWRYLPKGVVFENPSATTRSPDTFMKSPLTWTSLPASSSNLLAHFPFQGSTLPLANAGVAIVQCYQPDGTLMNTPSSSALTLTLITGTADTGTGNTTGTGNGSDWYDLYFVPNTGTTKIGRP